MRLFVFALSTVVATMALAACGSDDDAGSDPAEAGDAAANSNEESDDSAGDDTGADANDGEGSDAGTADADDFPIPMPDGLLLDVLADSGIPQAGQRQLYFPNDDMDRLVAFYDDWTDQNGEWARSEAEGTVAYVAIDEGVPRQISISPDHDPGAQAEGPVAFVLLVADVG